MLENFLKIVAGTLLTLTISGVIWGASLTGTVLAQGEAIEELQQDTSLILRMAIQLNYLTRQYCLDNGWGNCPDFIRDSIE